MFGNSIGEGENLGRGVFESKFAKEKTTIALTNFYRKALLPGSMSVDRIDIADLCVLCAVHDNEANCRADVERFYGWQTFTVKLAYSSGLSAAQKPTDDNDWHAEVYLPDEYIDDEDVLLTYCNALASETKWLPRPLDSRLQQEIDELTAQLDFE